MYKDIDRRLNALEARAPGGTADRSFVIWPSDEPPRYSIDGRAVDETEWHRRIAHRGPQAHVIRVVRGQVAV